MLIIADSGSTKTDWVLIDKGNQTIFKTIGFNPYHIKEGAIAEHLKQSELIKYTTQVSEIFFYGAGCSTKENKEIIHRALEKVFVNANIEVEHDLMAAARAVCGHSKGMVAILGTGSNTCLYDGKEITHNIPALGYILGDEGGGSYMGKEFIKRYLHDELPPYLKEQFETAYPYRLTDILNRVYKEPLPNEFLAQFTRFLKQYEEDSMANEIIENCFHDFFKQHICKYPGYQENDLNLIGSIAAAFGKQLHKVAQSYRVKIGVTIDKPIEALVRFHTVQ